MTLISIEGNIGSGKDEFINFFKKYFTDEILFIEDNVYNWKDKSLLMNFYKNPERWAFALQIQSITQKYKCFLNSLPYKQKGSVIITHRSPMSDNYCFEKACMDSGYITPKENDIYQNVFESYKIPKFHGVIYLKSNVNKCYEYIINTTDKIEKIINFDFLRNIDTNYEKWISKIREESIPLLEINVEEFRDLEGSEMVQQKLLSTILDNFPQLIRFQKRKR